MDLSEFTNLLSLRLHKNYTEEQIEFFKDFTTPVISFSEPGTGKTQSAVAGLLTAELYHHIPGSSITALSFTRMATAELRDRHEAACRQCGIKQTVNFQTLSSICTGILRENYKVLGFSRINIVDSPSVMDLSTFLMEESQEIGVDLKDNKVRALVRAIRKLNASLIFDRSHVETKMDFKKTGLSYEDFMKMRRSCYIRDKVTESIPLDDVLLFTLEILYREPKVCEAFKAKTRVLMCDEFQDMSLLQIRILSMLNSNLIAIGDINQQIYAFNGACEEIVAKYKEYYPTARVANLTQSFRCCDEIALFSKGIIAANKNGGQDFKGTGEHGVVEIKQHFNVSELCDQIDKEFRDNHNHFPESIMFLFRNNFSVIPIAEELHKRQVPYMVNKYIPAHQLPVIEDLCNAIELVRNPDSPQRMKILKKLIPEFAYYSDYTKIPLIKIVAENGCSIFDINYNFTNGKEGAEAMEMLAELRELVEKAVPVAELFNKIWPVYSHGWLAEHERYLEQDARYYTNLVAPLVQTKIYQVFIRDELDKVEEIKKWNESREGLRCYTLHAAKGTEADRVYIIDADAEILPNLRKLDEMVKCDCVIDAAREIRNERCLCYVGATRARKHLTITYSSELSSMFACDERFAGYDAAYSTYQPEFFDVEVFQEFYANCTCD